MRFPTTCHAPRDAGFVLLDALLAGVLLGMIALSSVALVQQALRVGREADRLDRGREIAERVLRDLERISYHGLPERFLAGAADRTARLASDDAGSPSAWRELASELPEGRIVARLEGLGPTGAPMSFDVSLALRVEVAVSWQESGRRRRVRVATVRL